MVRYIPRRRPLPELPPATDRRSRARGPHGAWVLLAFTLAVLADLPAQGNQPQGQPTPVGTQNPQDRRTTVRTEQQGGEEYLVISVNEADGLPLKDFVKMAEGITGRVFTFNEAELSQDPNSKVAFIGTMRIKKANFFSFFQTMLYIKGFACVPRGERDTEIVEIVFSNGPRRTEIQTAARYVAPEEIVQYANQTGVQILTSIPLEHVNANAAQTALRAFYSGAQAQQGGLQFGTVGNNRALLMQGYGPQVYAAAQLLKLLDLPPEATNTEVMVARLEHRASEELEPILNEILNDRNRAARQPAQGVAGGDVLTGQPIQLKILAYTPLNAVLLNGTREQILEAQDLIARLDVPVEASGGDQHVIRLKNVLSDDLRTTLNQFITEDQQAEQQAQQGQAQAGGVTQRRQRKTVVVSHKESNSLLVSGTASKFQQLLRTIEELDRRQPQVLVECAVVELTTGDIFSLGVELGLIDIKDNGDFTRPFGFTSFGLSQFQDTDDNGLPDTRLPDFENPLQGLTGGIISNGDFAIPFLVNALSSNEKANVLSLPSVVVNNNQTAIVKTTEDRPTQNVSQGNTSTQSGFSGFQGAGIELSISPSISTNSYLRLNIKLSVSRFLSAFDPASVTPGRKNTREISTQVTMPTGNTMVLGGVIEDGESENESGVPFLKDIPLIGYLFSTRGSNKQKTNLYFFLTPHILDEEDFSDLREVSFRKKLEAEEYIGTRRLQIVDRRWTSGKNPETLEDSGATLEDLDQRAGLGAPNYERPRRDMGISGTRPNGPALPGTTTRPTTQTK